MRVSPVVDGSPFDGQHGHGRAWPLLTGERAHYELSAGRRAEAVRLLRAVEQFAGPGGLIPEQVWDARDIPEHDLYFGRPTGSAMPLASGSAHAHGRPMRSQWPFSAMARSATARFTRG